MSDGKTCKDCKYYGDVNPDWAYTYMAEKNGAKYSCQKLKHNRQKYVCEGGPFLPEEEKKEEKINVSKLFWGSCCEICGKSCDRQWPGHENKWMCEDCHWGLHDDNDGTVTLTMPEAKKGKFYDFKFDIDYAKIYKPSSMLHNHIYLKGNKMKKLVKVLRRVIMLWVVYGAVKLGILVNPLVTRLAYFLDDSLDKSRDITSVVDATFVGWLTVIVGIAIFCAASYGFNKLSVLVFNEKN